MGITKLLSFEVEAEVFGTPRRVEFNESVLVIHDMSLDDAKRAIDALASNSYTEVKLGPIDPPAKAESKAEVKQEPSVPEEPKPKHRPKAKADPKPDLLGAAEDIPQRAEPAAEQKAADPQPQPEAPKVASNGDLLVDMARAKNLKEVVLLLQDHGITNLDRMVEECTRYHEQVPLFRAYSLPMLRERLHRTFGVVSGFPQQN